MELNQRGLVNRRVRTTDGEILTKYIIPFWDREWRVVLTVLDRFGTPPAIAFHAPQAQDASHVLLPLPSGDLLGLDRWNPDSFLPLFHYDPWWAFRGIGGVPDAVKRAILPANIAKRFKWRKQEWKVHDVIFSDGDGRVRAILAKNETFQRREFTRDEIDLDTTWPKEVNRKR